MRQQDRRIKRNVAVFKICQIFRSIFFKLYITGYNLVNFRITNTGTSVIAKTESIRCGHYIIGVIKDSGKRRTIF